VTVPGGGSTVGNITAYLRMEADQYIRKAREVSRATLEMEAAQRKQQVALDKVALAEKKLNDARKSGDTRKVTQATRELETARQRLASANERVARGEKNLGAEAERAAAKAARGAREMEAAVLREERAMQRAGRSAFDFGNRLNAIIAAAVILGPALIPLGAVGAAGLGALAEGAGVALLAVRGIKKEMKDGTVVGVQYQSLFAGLKTNIDQLSTTAADTALPFVGKAIGNINDVMPELNSETKQYTALLGQMGDVLVHGVLSGFVQLHPLMLQIFKDSLSLAQGFDRFASGNSLQKFGDWALNTLPIVEQDIGDIAQALGKLIVAGASSGVTVLDLLSGIARGLDAIPLPVLKVLVPTLLALYTASKLAALGTAINTKITGAYTAALLRQAAAAETAAAAERDLAVATGEAGAANKVGGGVGFLPIGRPGAARTSTIETVERNAGRVGAAGASLFPPTAILLIAAALGHQLANNPIIKAQDATRLAGGGVRNPTNQGPGGNFLFNAINKNLFGPAKFVVPKEVKQQQDFFAKQTTNFKAQQDAAAATDAAFDKIAKSALAARDSQQQEMAVAQLSGNVHDVLALSLDAVNKKFLNTAEASTAEWQAINNVTKTLKDNKAAIKGHSDAALEDQSAIQQATRAIQARALALSDGGKNEAKSIGALIAGRDAMFRSLKAQGLLTKSVRDYINSILHIPKWVATLPKFNSATAQARMVDYIKRMGGIPALKNTTFNLKTGTAVTRLDHMLTVYNALTDKTVTISTNVLTNAPGRADLPGQRNARGGLLSGPGSGTSDDIPIRASNGEFVVNAAQTAKHLDLLENINKGVAGFASGGSVGRQSARPMYASTTARSRQISSFRPTGSTRGLVHAPMGEGPWELSGTVALDDNGMLDVSGAFLSYKDHHTYGRSD